jgi:hypothetical protein
MASLLGIVLLSLLVVPSQAWSPAVHNQIGFLAERFLEPRTTDILRKILEPEYNGSIGQGAGWADSFKQTEEGAHTGVWHYINAADNVCKNLKNKVLTIVELMSIEFSFEFLAARLLQRLLRPRLRQGRMCRGRDR